MQTKPNLFTSILFTALGVMAALWAFGLIAIISTIAGFLFVAIIVKQTLNKLFNAIR